MTACKAEESILQLHFSQGVEQQHACVSMPKLESLEACSLARTICNLQPLTLLLVASETNLTTNI